MKPSFIISIAFLLFLSSCGNSKKEKNAQINDKKQALEKAKEEKVKLEEQIKELEKSIALLDPSSANVQNAKLVTVQTLEAGEFSHFIELQGKIDAENISYVTPRGGPAQVKGVYVKKGDRVKKGQLLLKLDDAILRQNVIAAKQGLENIKTQLSYAKNLYQRQKNLWDQNIGTEVQLITAKNNVASLENQLNAAQENIKVVQEQLNTTNVYSDVNGVADEVNIRVGETFTGAPPNVIKIVNNSSLKIIGDVPENYLNNVHNGIAVVVQVPDINRTFNTTISFTASSIDPLTRGFSVEAKLPADSQLKPNQIALMKIRDYAAENTIAIPVNTLQNDEKGKFVMVVSTEKGKVVARKRPVEIGLLNNDKLEIKAGLKAGDILITEGFQSLYDGQLITMQ